MAPVIAQFFGIIGLDMLPPANMQDLIPYLLTVFVGVFLVAAVFSVIREIVSVLFGFRRF